MKRPGRRPGITLAQVAARHEQFAAMHRDGRTIYFIAKHFGVTWSTVDHALSKPRRVA